MTYLRIAIVSLAICMTVTTPSLARRRDRSKEKFTFIVYGDTRSNKDAVEPVTDDQIQTLQGVHQRVIKQIVDLKPEFIMQTGDLVKDNSVDADWTMFDRVTQPLRDAKIPCYPSRGNHDAKAEPPSGKGYTAHFNLPFDSGDKKTKFYYAFSRHNNRFIVVDSMQPYTPGSAQYRWLEDELKKFQGKATNTFVMFHESPYSVGPHAVQDEAMITRAYLCPLFIKYKPRAVFCGHDHLYYRTQRGGVPYVVTGGAGAPVYHPENINAMLPEKAVVVRNGKEVKDDLVPFADGDVTVLPEPVVLKDANGAALDKYISDIGPDGKPLPEADYDAQIYHVVKCEVDGKRIHITAIGLDGRTIDDFVVD